MRGDINFSHVTLAETRRFLRWWRETRGKVRRCAGSADEKEGALPLDQALSFAIQIANVLDKANRAGIVHRDHITDEF